MAVLNHTETQKSEKYKGCPTAAKTDRSTQVLMQPIWTMIIVNSSHYINTLPDTHVLREGLLL